MLTFGGFGPRVIRVPRSFFFPRYPDLEFSKFLAHFFPRYPETPLVCRTNSQTPNKGHFHKAAMALPSRRGRSFHIQAGLQSYVMLEVIWDSFCDHTYVGVLVSKDPGPGKNQWPRECAAH